MMSCNIYKYLKSSINITRLLLYNKSLLFITGVHGTIHEFYSHAFSRNLVMENNRVMGAKNIIVDGKNLGAVQLNGMYYTLVLF